MPYYARPPSEISHFTRPLTSKFAYWPNDVIVDVMSSNMFVDIIKVFILQWLATDNDQQSYQRLTQTSERARFGAFWTFCVYYVNWVVALNMA